MIKSSEVSNFRVFDDIKVELSDVNIIAGKNNVGKTAFLEAIYLLAAAHNPSKTQVVHSKRTGGPIVLDPDRLWGWLFRMHNTDREIEIKSVEDDIERRLKIRLEIPDKVELKKSSSNGNGYSDISTTTTLDSDKSLVFEYNDTQDRRFTIKGWTDDEGDIQFENRKQVFPNSIYIDANRGFTIHDVKRYSDIEEVRKEDRIIKALRKIEPRIEDLSVSVSQGAPSIMGDIGQNRLFPLSMLGQGVARVLSFAVGILYSEGGVVLIDEVENGIHHSVMADVWRAIHDIASISNTQVIASTHSYECIEAAHKAFSDEAEYPLLLHRFAREEEGISVNTFREEDIRTSIDMGLEVR